MELKLTTCFVLVDDPDRALSFYRDLLGLEVRSDVARGTLRWITVGSPAQPQVGIVLTNYVAGSDEDRRLVAQLLAKGGLYGVHLSTPDLDRCFERLRAAGAQIVEEPTEQPWGPRDFALRDPAGNLLRIAEAR